MKISFIIPALNEEAGIEAVIRQIATAGLDEAGYEKEIIVVDNGSEDRTGEIARSCGATVVKECKQGYGNAYKAGFAKATGDIIITGDADMTYPFDHSPELIEYLLTNDLEFLNTNRLEKLNPGLVAHLHALGTFALTVTIKLFFKCPFRDSQSGMWIFKRYILDTISVESPGMPFSQEIKIEAFTRGFRCAEVPIEYRPRVGESKLNTFHDGWGAFKHLFQRRLAANKKRGTANDKSA
ncbi:MAG: glycosyltransferase family 2 protein [Patescibacteria group bacterium]